MVVYSVGRSAAAFVETSTGTLTIADVDAVAHHEYALLEHDEPTFSLAVPTRSDLASVLYGLVAVALAVVAYLLPALIRRERKQRAAKRDAQRRHEHRARGSKVLRRRQLSFSQQTTHRRT